MKKTLVVVVAVLMLTGVGFAKEHRSEAVVRRFEKQTGHVHGWKGHVADHLDPLACGGADAVSNLGWQTVKAGKWKDKFERKDCSVWTKPNPPCWVQGKERIEHCRVPKARSSDEDNSELGIQRYL